MDEPERLSKLVFGSRYRLAVFAAVAQASPQSLYAKAIAERSQVAANTVGKVLAELAEAGLLQRTGGPPGGGAPVLYKRSPSRFWRLARQLHQEVLTDGTD